MKQRGRRKVLTDEVLTKLVNARIRGASMTEAAREAGISRSTLYKYLEKDKDVYAYMQLASLIQFQDQLQHLIVYLMAGKE